MAKVKILHLASILIVIVATVASGHNKEPACISGIYPHLAMTSSNSEIGCGALVPWAGKLWVITYGPHLPNGSDDKLYAIDNKLNRITHPNSVGGTPANRMIHDESKQLIIGPYFINRKGIVSVISPKQMPGRITACARHLTDPANKVYFFTMEDGLYEVNVHSKAIKTLYPDIQPHGDRFLFGYHGKGAYTGQSLLFAANNGRTECLRSLNGPSGVLACWDGSLVADFGGKYNPARDTNTDQYETPQDAVPPRPGYMSGWHQISRVQHTEITGPGGIHGSHHKDDPIWTLGFDRKSVLLQTIEGGKLRTWRLPKGSYSADGIHGWHTEWPRIRRLRNHKFLSRDKWLMHMHGIFYDFPATFSIKNFSGLEPICDFCKMPVDYCMFNGKLVIGKNDASRFNNKFVPRAQSNLWFGEFDNLKNWGVPSGFGGVWLNEDIAANHISAPFLVNGFKHTTLHLSHSSPKPITIDLENSNGKGNWKYLTSITIPPGGYTYAIIVDPEYQWLRLRLRNDSKQLSAYFMLSNPYSQKADNTMFASLADATQTNNYSSGIIRPMPQPDMQLEFSAKNISNANTTNTGYYCIGSGLKLTKVNNQKAKTKMDQDITPENSECGWDAASAWIMDGNTKLRLPKFDTAYEHYTTKCRTLREVVTERHLLNLHGTFYEIPRPTAGGRRRMKPITTHGKHITDFASWRGMLVLCGVDNNSSPNEHIRRASDGTALWLGEIDDIWQMGEPRGYGGPWKNSPIKAGIPSDPYLMAGYDHKELTISHNFDKSLTFIIEVDFLGNNSWFPYRALRVPPRSVFSYIFPRGFQAHWVRIRTNHDTTATAQFNYGPLHQ